MNRIFVILYVLIVCRACSPTAESVEISLYVAASLSPAVTALASAFEEQQDVHIIINTASSGTLARQIAQGAPTDLFISANRQWMEYLQKKELILKQRTLSVTNQLVLVVPSNSAIESINLSNTNQWNDFLSSKRLAMGDPNHVPVGQYAMQAIETLHWRLVPQQTLQTKDARATLVAVEFGEADLGIVYRSDAEKSEKVKIIIDVPFESYDPINYSVGVCSNDSYSTEFLNFMSSPEAKRIWKAHGFTFDEH